jgi:hypothetical protein
MRRLILAARGRSREEDGIVLVLLAVGMVVFLGVAAVAIDLGVAYASSRQMQNAADAAALAGTQELECLKFAPATDPAGCQVFPATAAAVASVVSSTAVTNGSDPSQLTCSVISGYIAGTTPDFQVIGPCSSPSSWTPYLHAPNASGQQADGVAVGTGATEHAFFGGSTGVRNLSQHRQAAATVQSLAGGGAPLLACAFDQTDQETGGAAPNLLVTSATSPSGYATNPAAVYNPGTQSPQYLLHGPHVSTCNLSSDGWKGLADESQSWPSLPGWLPILTGDKAGPTRVALANQQDCASLDAGTGCVLVLPICTTSNNHGGINGLLYCVGYGAFKLLSSKSNSQNFAFLGLANASSGVTGQGNPDPDGVNVVTLIQ